MADGEIYLGVTVTDTSGGEIYLQVSYDDGIHPDPVPPPHGSVAADLYSSHRHVAHDDSKLGWPLLHLCEAVGRMWQAVNDVIVDTDDGPGWSATVDVDRAPGPDAEINFLTALGQTVGVRGIERLSDAEQREAIRRREGLHRGRREAIIAAAESTLTGSRRVILRERFDPALGPDSDAAYDITVLTLAEETPDVGVTQAVTQAALPGGLILHYQAMSGVDFEQIREDFANFGALRDAFADFDQLRNYDGGEA